MWETIISFIPEGIKSVLGWLNKPKPDISFEYLLSQDNENEYCHLRRNRSFGLMWSWFFRLGVNNFGKQRIEEADVRVEKIEEVDSKKIITTTPFFLHWANEDSDNSRSIYFKTPVFLDVVYTVEGQSNFLIFHKSKHSGSGIPSYLPVGNYKFTIKLLGANIDPLEREIFINFNGNWEQLKMKINEKSA